MRRHGLSSLLEAHCYVGTGGKRIDVTKASSERSIEPIERFLYEEEMDPKQITHYKTAVHKKFLMKWMADNGGLSGCSPRRFGRFERHVLQD